MKFFIKKELQEPAKSQHDFKTRYKDYTIGINTYGVPEVFNWEEGTTLIIGSYCSIAHSVKIYLGGHHRKDWISTYPFPAFFNNLEHIKNYGGTNGDVEIGSDVWICANVTILSGVKIGNGAILANGSVVTKNVSDYEVVGGNPAKHIQFRFNEDIRKELLNIKWWEWDEEEIISIVDILCSDNIEDIIKYSETRNTV